MREGGGYNVAVNDVPWAIHLVNTCFSKQPLKKEKGLTSQDVVLTNAKVFLVSQIHFIRVYGFPKVFLKHVTHTHLRGTCSFTGRV